MFHGGNMHKYRFICSCGTVMLLTSFTHKLAEMTAELKYGWKKLGEEDWCCQPCHERHYALED